MRKIVIIKSKCKRVSLYMSYKNKCPNNYAK